MFVNRLLYLHRNTLIFQVGKSRYLKGVGSRGRLLRRRSNKVLMTKLFKVNVMFTTMFAF